MARLMSFALTAAQIRARSKTVTRRVGWRHARRGMEAQPVAKGQGLKRGETVDRIGGLIRFVDVRREPLAAILTYPDPAAEVAAEGFPGMRPEDFVALVARANGCTPDTRVTRIAFEYLPEAPLDDDTRRRLAARFAEAIITLVGGEP